MPLRNTWPRQRKDARKQCKRPKRKHRGKLQRQEKQRKMKGGDRWRLPEKPRKGKETRITSVGLKRGFSFKKMENYAKHHDVKRDRTTGQRNVRGRLPKDS